MKTKMKLKSNLWVSILLIVVLVALMIPAVRFVRDNSISKSNGLKRKAEKEYLATDYVSAYNTYKVLIDSLNNIEDPVGINYANAAYLSSELLMKGLRERATMGQGAASDSTLQQIGYYGKEKYAQLTTSAIPGIASIASNQLGYASLKGSNVFESPNADSVLFIALDHFKNALRSDPSNDSARYNYELLKMIVLFPETVLSETKALIAQKRYRQAAAVLARGMRRDPRLRQQQDFMNRLRTVIAIDSLEGRGS
jgi:Ca-activated chloride channel family protein